MNNDQLRAMYNGFGTLNRPQNYGDDLYNDRENMMPSAGQELTQTGTDEAGNPVMAPAATPAAPQQEQAPLDNLIDFARNRMQQSQNQTDLSAFGAMAPIAEGMRDLWNATPEERAQMLNVPQRMENAVRGVIHSMSNATELEHTQLYENYFYNPQRKNDEINRIAKLLQIDGNAFANNRELYQKAALAADRVERMGKFKKYQDAEGNIDMAKIYADIPGLTEIQKQQGTAAAALALGNIDGVRSINDVYDNAFSRFVGSVYAGARRGWISDRRSAIWNDARKEARLPNAEEQKELDAYDAELRELPKYNYNTVGNVAGAMVGGAAENLAMIVKSQGAGMAARVAVGRLGGARAGDIASNVVSTYMMAQDIAGQQYEELINKTDAYGRPMYTPEQASRLALAQGAGEAVLEQYSLNQMGKAIFGRSAAPALRDIIKNSPTLEAAKAGVREYASTKILEATKAGLISLGAEAAEEFNQAASDMLMENVAQVMINGQDAHLSSIDDILTASTGQMLEALPAIGGFGLIGFGANPIANTRAVLGFRSHVRDVVNNKILIGRMANAHYGEVLSGVWDNKKNIKELQDKAPEVAQTILDAQNKIAGIESGFVDVKALQQQEGGDALVKDIAERNNVSEDELAACLDGSGMLQVKTSTLMQMDLQDAQRKAIMDNVTTSLDAFTEAQTSAAIKLAQDQMKSLQNFNDKTYKAAVDNIIAARFPDAEQARLAREIIETNYDNPQEEFKRRLDAVNAEMDEYVGPVLKELRSGMKQGVDIIRVEDGRDAGYVKQSNNAEWYRNWFADNGRAPNNEELLGLAIDIASGRQNARYGLQDYQNNTEESRQYFGNVAQTLDRLEEQRNALMAIQDRMRDLNPGEMVATASLSKEGLKVYDTMRRMMGESGNADVQKAGRFNALFLARYADNTAKVFSKVRNVPYTAEDFVRDRFRLDTNAVYNEASQQEAAQLFQVSPEEFARQKAEVRKQYEGTDGWMKAPNGYDTNLTEDQWITVRTPAFKNWFGDWENNPQSASKVLDENGEPLIVYHGTVAGEFNTFDRSYGSVESDMGNGFYFTNNERDVKNNYEGGGPDFENKVARLAERIEADEEIDYEEAEARARAELFTEGYLFNTFLNIRYPAYVRSTTLFVDEAELQEDINEEDYEDEDEYYQAQNEAMEAAWSDLISSITDRVEYDELMNDTGSLANVLWEAVYNGGIDIPALKEQINELYPEDAEGNFSANEILRIVIDELGYDGIIDETVSEKFRGMDLSPDTTHYIAFEPNQIKDASGRNAGFDPNSANIYYQKENERNNKILERQKAEVRMQYQNTDEWLKAPNGKDTNLTEDQWVTVRTRLFKRWFGNWEKDPANASKLLDENGEPRVVYHGTGADFDAFDINYLGAASGDVGWFGKGFYFAFNEDEARMYDDRRIIPAFVNLRKPLYFTEEMETYDGVKSSLYGAEDMVFLLNVADKLPELAKGKTVEVSAEDGGLKRLSVLDSANEVKDIINNTEFRVDEVENDYGEKEYVVVADRRVETYTDSEGKEHSYVEYGFQHRFADKQSAENKLNQAYTYLKDRYDYMNIPRFMVFVQESDFNKALTDRGYDGVLQSKDGDEVVAFEPNQIKDATGRNIGFDPGSNNIYFQASYHGTPNRFDRFDTGHIGEGEGAQVHGWGLYFAKDRKVAEGYRNRLIDNDYKVTFTGKVLKSKQQLIDAAITEIRWGLNEGLSVDEAIQKRIDFYRDQLKFFEDHPKQATKSKVKKAQDKIDFLTANRDKFKAERQGQVFEVDIPDDDVLLDEQKTFDEQPAKVKAGIRKLLDDYSNRYSYKKVGDEYVVYEGDREVDRYEDEEDAATAARENNEAIATTLEARGLSGDELKNAKGRAIYLRLSGLYLEDEATSKKLNEYGVKGITYDGFQDGRSYVVFDDKAIEILNKYYQQGKTAKGSISLNQQGQRIISLFESADQSTFIHEMSHMFLLDLQEVAGIDPNSRQAKDLKTIMDWAEYKPGQADEYKGTASAEEFRRRDAEIQAAEKAGNTVEAQRLKDIWAQERFARGFEEYLKSGEAPAAGLKNAFRQFKKWLIQIYNDVLGAGVRATPEVEAIMARMVASEEEIDAMEAANNIARLRKVDPDILSEDAQALRDRWQEEAKERAKEKMLKELMKQYEQQNLKDLDKRLEDARTAAREEMQNVPCFVCEQLLKDGTDMASALEICGFASEQEYKDALQAAGGSMEKALDNTVAQARENMLTAMPSKDALYTMAEEALLSGDYNIRLAELEAEMLKAREAAYQNAPARLRRALTEVDEAIRTFETQAVRQAVQKLKYAERWGAKDLQTIQELEKHLADLDKADATKEERQKVKDQFEAKYKELKRRTVQNEQWLRNVRDATDGKVKALRIMARAQMASQQLSAATNPRYWHRQALSEGKAAWQEITRAQRKGEEVNARAAVTAKETQAYYDAMTAEAITNRKKVDRLLNSQRGIKARGKRMADPKFKADANMRYYHNHLLYIFGLRNSDAIAPSQVKTFTEVLAELRAGHQFEEEVPAWLIAAADATTQDKNYQQLTLGEFEELDKLTRVLYTLAKNQNQLLTLDVDMDTVVADCGADWMNHVDYEVGNQRINEVKGAIGDYMNGLLKPEVLLSIMGGKDGGFIKYIYRVLFKAAEAEEIAREKEAAAQKELYKSFYTQQELRAMVNDPVMVEGPDGTRVKLQIGDDTDITKENLICMALNWGNEANRARLVVGLFDCENDAELAERQEELKGILSNTLTEKDWQFVQAMWDHINTFATPVSEVLEKSIGVPLDRVKADAFTVDMPDGTQLNMAGGYYPIVKDSSKSSRQSEFDQMEEAKAVGGVSVFGTGMSATKARADNLFLNQGPLKLTLDVASKHITAQIHLIHAKMAVRDAYKVLNDKTIKEMIRRTCGEGTVKSMNEWVLNCWAPPVRPHSWYESMAAQLRSKTVGAIMGYRVSTALLNLANVVYMAQEIGTKNALAAMADFYQHPFRNRQQILDVSVFMRNRATNMDRDLGAQEEQLLKRHNMVGNAIDKATGGKSEEMRYLMDKYANWLIEQTDMLVSMPLYQWQYKETYSQQIQDGVPEEQAREAANFEATRRVTKVFGSSRALDTSAVQRSKNEIVKLITPFFTFANTMMNAVWSHYYEGKYTADKKTFTRRYAAFTRAILFNFVLGALVETMLRQVPDVLAGTGGDDDDDKFMKTVGKNVLANAVAGFPGVNELINTSYELFTEKKSYGSGRGVGVLSGSLERGIKVIQDAAKLTQGSDKIDAVDFFRDVARAANVKTGMSDTITDAVFNTVRFASDNYSLDNMDDLREYIAKSIFDRKLKKK